MSQLGSLLRAASDVERRMLVGVVVVATLILGFGLLASEVIEGDTKAFDEGVLGFFRAPTDPSRPAGPAWLTDAMRDVTALGSTSVLTLVVVGVAGYLAVSGLRHAGAMVLGSVALGVVLSNSLKVAEKRHAESISRGVSCYHETGYSVCWIPGRLFLNFPNWPPTGCMITLLPAPDW